MTKFEEAMTKKQYTIYRLWHESTPGVRYVGVTTQPLIDRLMGHLHHTGPYNRGNAGHNQRKEQWIISLISHGLAPHIDELDILYGTFAEASKLEDSWINYYLSCEEFTLLNAKLPKQAQTLAKGEPSVTDKDYEQDNKNTVITESFGPLGYINYDTTLDRFQGTVYISPNRKLTSTLPNYFTLTCDNEK